MGGLRTLAAGCVALGVGMLAAGLTMMSPLYNGPVARLLGGADLSWVLGFPVSAAVYIALARLQVHPTAATKPTP